MLDSIKTLSTSFAIINTLNTNIFNLAKYTNIIIFNTKYFDWTILGQYKHE